METKFSMICFMWFISDCWLVMTLPRDLMLSLSCCSDAKDGEEEGLWTAPIGSKEEVGGSLDILDIVDTLDSSLRGLE